VETFTSQNYPSHIIPHLAHTQVNDQGRMNP